MQPLRDLAGITGDRYHPAVPHSLDYYRQQRDLALQQADSGDVDREGWLRIADEWQKLFDALATELNQSPADKHVLDL